MIYLDTSEDVASVVFSEDVLRFTIIFYQIFSMKNEKVCQFEPNG